MTSDMTIMQDTVTSESLAMERTTSSLSKAHFFGFEPPTSFERYPWWFSGNSRWPCSCHISCWIPWCTIRDLYVISTVFIANHSKSSEIYIVYIECHNHNHHTSQVINSFGEMFRDFRTWEDESVFMVWHIFLKHFPHTFSVARRSRVGPKTNINGHCCNGPAVRNKRPEVLDFLFLWSVWSKQFGSC